MLDQQRKYIYETTSKDEQLKKALEDISALNKKLAEERTESEEKVKNYDEFISTHTRIGSFSSQHRQLGDFFFSPYRFSLKCVNL